MRARPREINIFNMSLLDILCGALGAFCFMMLVALPYYVVGKVDRAKSQQRTEELMKDVEKLRERMSDPAQAEELRNLIEELETQIKQLQGELNQYTYENEQLKQENTRLADENTRLTSENTSLTSDNTRLKSENSDLTQENAEFLADKALLQDANERLTQENTDLRRRDAASKPFAVLANAINPRFDISVYLEDVKVGIFDKSQLANRAFEPTTLNQTSRWPDDLSGILVPQRGVAVWVSSATVTNSSYRVFVKGRVPVAEGFPLNAQAARSPVTVSFYGNLAAAQVPKPMVVLNEERYWALVGTLNVNDKGELEFKEATEAERDEAWRTIMKDIATPTPAPTATPQPSVDFEQIDRRRKADEARRKAEEMRREREGASPAPSATPESGSDMAERALRLRREREAQSPTPTASASP